MSNNNFAQTVPNTEKLKTDTVKLNTVSNELIKLSKKVNTYSAQKDSLESVVKSNTTEIDELKKKRLMFTKKKADLDTINPVIQELKTSIEEIDKQISILENQFINSNDLLSKNKIKAQIDVQRDLKGTKSTELNSKSTEKETMKRIFEERIEEYTKQIKDKYTNEYYFKKSKDSIVELIVNTNTDITKFIAQNGELVTLILNRLSEGNKVFAVIADSLNYLNGKLSIYKEKEQEQTKFLGGLGLYFCISELYNTSGYFGEYAMFKKNDSNFINLLSSSKTQPEAVINFRYPLSEQISVNVGTNLFDSYSSRILSSLNFGFGYRPWTKIPFDVLLGVKYGSYKKLIPGLKKYDGTELLPDQAVEYLRNQNYVFASKGNNIEEYLQTNSYFAVSFAIQFPLDLVSGVNESATNVKK